jgi:hypothetical protein
MRNSARNRQATCFAPKVRVRKANGADEDVGLQKASIRSARLRDALHRNFERVGWKFVGLALPHSPRRATGVSCKWWERRAR